MNTRRFFDEVEQEIQRYEYTFHTGNAALDSVLSEKSLYCSANHILLTTMLDVSLLAPIEKSDIYSIFGNALDNAIQAVMAEAPENRSVNIRVSDVVGMTQIVFENFAASRRKCTRDCRRRRRTHSTTASDCAPSAISSRSTTGI